MNGVISKKSYHHVYLLNCAINLVLASSGWYIAARAGVAYCDYFHHDVMVPIVGPFHTEVLRACES